MSISDKIQALETSRQAIAAAITQKGGTVAQGDGFSQFATEISNLPSGGSGNKLLTSIDVSDFTGTTFESGVKYITGVTIPSGVTAIGKSAFQNFSSISSVTIPSGVTSIGSNAFLSSGITSLTIPNSVRTIGEYAFNECTSLVSINIPEGITIINQWAFRGCSSLRKITIPSTVTAINSNAFYYCTSMRSITCLATTPPTYQVNALDNTNNCPIYVPSASVAAYKTSWTDYASRIQAIEDAITFTPTNGDPAISVKNYELATANYVQSTDVPATIKNGAGSLEIGEGVTHIGTFAFQNGSSLTSVTLPSTLTRIDEAALMGCTSLTSVTVNATTPPTLYAAAFDSTNNCPIYVPRMSVDTYKAASGWSTYASRISEIPVHVATLTLNDTSTVDIIDTTGLGTIQQNITSQYASTTVGALIKADALGIGLRAFRNFANLASVTFETGSQCTTIGTNAFQNCTSLTSITLPDSVGNIDGTAFGGCTSLETVTIGDSITDIEGSAFAGCESLTDITILADAAPDGSGEDPFEGCDATITMHVPAESVSAYEAWLNDDLGTAAAITVVAISE